MLASCVLCFCNASLGSIVLCGSGDLAGRLAVVPMSQEAKGLDAGPRLAEKLVGCGDNRSAAIVSRIAAEEKAHVAVGESLQSCFAHHLSYLLRPSCSAFAISQAVCLSIWLSVGCVQ